jgi:hypothetical protein
MSDPQSRSAKEKDAALRRANGHFQVWEDRTTLVKQEQAAERAASEAKTIRLRALRLAKEAEDSEIARVAAKNAPPAKPGKRKA